MNTLITLFAAHQYLAAAVVVVGFAFRILQADSKFPITIPQKYQPATLLVLGQSYAILVAIQGGLAWPTAIAQGLTVSFIVVVLRSLFVPEPVWLQWLSGSLPSLPPPPAVEITVTDTTEKS